MHIGFWVKANAKIESEFGPETNFEVVQSQVRLKLLVIQCEIA